MSLAAAELTAISIVIPTYNRARLLANTLESVKALIVPVGIRIELLVRIAGNVPLSFQYELETRRLISYLRGAV
jgi:hypothetical protein